MKTCSHPVNPMLTGVAIGFRQSTESNPLLRTSMTAARRQRKPSGAARSAHVAALFAISCLFAVTVRAAQDPRVEVDPRTGLAIGGFDPVAYFAEHAPRLGRPDFEVDRYGVVWRFENPGNRAAFAAHPDVYRPQFGGYDPVAVGRGALVPGHPLVSAIAARKWPQVEGTAR